ncbi:MAG: molybdenum cofactor guanylyltransferase [Chitinophagaceae bacterium]|nr:molybdenum cofactor guanylyltransferase [Chitinophagaceae bacterium]
MTGLILCGGAGSRLGQEKGLLNFHGQPQYQFLYSVLEGLLGKAVLSCKKTQEPLLKPDMKKVFDSPMYDNAGPLTGILSAHRHFPDDEFIVVACDYPAVNKQTLGKFLDHLQGGKLTIFYNADSGFYETVLGYYPIMALKELDMFYKSGGRSIQDFIRVNEVAPYTPADPNFFLNINTHEDLIAYLENKASIL